MASVLVSRSSSLTLGLRTLCCLGKTLNSCSASPHRCIMGTGKLTLGGYLLMD